ncbi:MAG: hypothetical protein JSU79_00185 [Dehalococcoidales bacterium]|nr:MAG: hypothetical protein JSU79_00185 [Dehalococcoidales bacterium]
MSGELVLITAGGILAGLAIIGIILYLINRKIKTKLNKLQLLAVASGIGIIIFAVLHNVVYALGIVWFGDDFWVGGDEATMFIIALFVCPLGLVGAAIGTIILRKRRQKREGEN